MVKYATVCTRSTINGTKKEARTCVKLSAYHHTRELNFGDTRYQTIFITRTARSTWNETVVRFDKNIRFKNCHLKMVQEMNICEHMLHFCLI